MAHQYGRVWLLISLFVSFSTQLFAQLVYAPGRIQRVDGSTQTGEIAYTTGKTGDKLLFRLDNQASPIAYIPNELRSFEVESGRFVSWRPNSDSASSAVFIQQLVDGPASLYLYRRSDRIKVYLLKQKGEFTIIHPRQPSSTLATLPDCGSIRPTAFDTPLSLNSARLSRYLTDYNRCVEPGSTDKNANLSYRALKVAIGARLYIPVTYGRLHYSDGATSPPSTISVKPGVGISVNFSWERRLTAGLDVALINKTINWNTDSTAKRVWIVDALSSQSLYVSPFLRYEFRKQNHQRLVPYVVAGLVFNKLLNGQLTINRLYPRNRFTATYDDFVPWTATVNKEAGLDELGGSLGGGLLWQLANRVTLVTDMRLVYSAAFLSVYKVPTITYNEPALSPRTFQLNNSIGINIVL